MPDQFVPPLWLIVAAVAFALVVGALLERRVRQFWMRRQLARRFGHARRGEAQARAWLERHGFTVLDEQVSQPSYLVVDGEEAPFTVRADYLVERNGVRAVVEVKTGDVADPSSRGTRRQVLEYAWVYGVAEVYLFNADTECLHRIGVPAMSVGAAPAQRRAWPILTAFAAGVGVGARAVWWFLS